MRILENDALRVEIADHGAELSAVTDKATGADRLWCADPKAWNRHAPILFPFVGKVKNGQYRIGSAAYPMKTQHGFARDLDFACVEATETSVTHMLCASEATKALYPYDFRLTVRHALDEADPRTLHIGWHVENAGAETMFFSIGGHPGFLPPKGVEKERCLLHFAGKDAFSHFGVTVQGFALPDTVYPLPASTVPYDASLADTWIFPDGQVDAVSLCRPDGALYVTLSCPGFPFLAVWSKTDAPFVCLEPWFGRTDDDDFTGAIDEKPGVQTLLPGEAKQYAYSITFFA
ncbi:MAG: aldose 1-epimerase family protein [Clostridia bacterium]|nr:aldose 1-epimerase family protein [Clostridia bacterium]